MASSLAANVHDFNGNGTGDQLFWDNNGGTGTVEFWEKGVSHPLGSVDPSQFDFVGTGDLNGDGTTDIVWQARQTSGGVNTGDIVVWALDHAGVAHAQDIGAANGYHLDV